MFRSSFPWQNPFSLNPHKLPNKQKTKKLHNDRERTKTHSSSTATGNRRMRLWKRASGVLKDRSSIWHANLTRRTALRNPDIEKSIIRATGHHEATFDRRSVDRVCEWIRLSQLNLKPILWSVSNRMEKTRDWVVALKALYLVHVVMNTRAPSVKKVGRLPFDSSNFEDRHLRQSKAWPYNAFIRAYYAFLDQKSTIFFQHAEDEREGFVMMKELVQLQKLQNLVDLLMQIKPASRAAFVPLVLHVMDGIIIEIYDIYSRICRGIALVLINIYSAGKAEATMALHIVKKATRQGDDLLNYLEFCQEIGVVNASEFPVIDRVPDEGIGELEQIIKRFDSDRLIMDEMKDEYEEKGAIVVVREVEKSDQAAGKYLCESRTIITDNWEKFDEDLVSKNPFGSPVKNLNQNQEPPDLMTFV